MADRPRAPLPRGGGGHLERAAGVRGREQIWLRRVDETGLAVAELPRRVRLDQVVDAGAATADVLIDQRQQLDPGDRSQEIAGRLPDALRVREVAGVLVRDPQRDR